MMWEYKWLSTPTLDGGGDASQRDEALKRLNEAGQERWEVVGATPRGFLLKRPALPPLPLGIGLVEAPPP